MKSNHIFNIDFLLNSAVKMWA